MLFNSIEFLFFFIAVFVIYWVLGYDFRKQNIFLLISSYVFYGWWDWRFLSLIVLCSCVNYIVGLRIFKADKQAKNWLIFGLIFNLGTLAVFKYLNFFTESFVEFVSVFGWHPNSLTLSIVLPVGISFYSFQALSYIIDVYRKELVPTGNVFSFFTFIAFFPQLVAGPIERASNLLPQIERQRIFKKEWFNAGLIQILVGLFRKIVIADSLGVFVDVVYGNLDIYNSSTILLATFLYSFQIYYDFAGYSDIAIGTAKLLGFKFRKNFNLPYFSSSLTEFWRRWHISLSLWFRDYVYISFGGNRKGLRLTIRNVMLTMVFCGLWHGDSFNYLVWGMLHGIVLSIEKILKMGVSKRVDSVYLFKGVLTFCIVMLAWVFFRASTLDEAFVALDKILTFNFNSPFIGNRSVVINAFFVLTIGLGFDLFLFIKGLELEKLGSKFGALSISIFGAVIVIFMNLLHSSSTNFIYFQF